MTVRTRFAPSPTGYLHIGGVRTALFNWLFARKHGGQFILRIDDTDAERNRAEALQPILDGFQWLGITWDEGPGVGGPFGPYFQSQRGQLYRDAVLKLLESGHAYPDYMSKEETDTLRKQAESQKQNYVHRGRDRTLSPADAVRSFGDKPTTIRLKVPENRTIVVNDQICGKVEVQTNLLGDPVIARADGSALYNFATVIDDLAMGITHIIRAKEHLSNTPTQVLVYEALGVAPPIFAHVPVVNAPNSKEKLSKRKMQQFMTPEVIALLRNVHAVPAEWTDEQIKKNENLNPATVAYYRTLGYLPQALLNYFGRLGWSLDDKTEIMSLDTMIANFGFERVNDSPASFDPQKLHWVAGEYLKSAPIEHKIDGVIPVLQRAGLLGTGVDREKIGKVVAACGDRLKIYADVLNYAAFFFRDPQYDPKAVKQRLHKEGMTQTLRQFAEVLQKVDPFDAATLEASLQTFSDAKQVKAGDINHALRVATTGVMIGPGVFECLAILGKDETLRRIDVALQSPL
ncbi:MAG: glutamate--tRNA ligase [Planctomycetes bacterium]|nr:glutamate--tRNA ligase [Planctomycetota bacterium]